MNNSYVKCVGQNKAPIENSLESFDVSSPSSAMMQFKSGGTSGATLKKELFFYDNDLKAWDIFTDPMHYRNYNHLGRNDLCGCNSGKKFKKCCYNSYMIVEGIWRAIRDKNLSRKIMLHPSAQIELSITEF